ncbi:MAG: ThiF family adenylyltransferase [Candidatus Helarchaeota archaeon]|nr:ThiF family adenylyltransferase [Candidatus Helarchaeota archaeon]
MEFSTLFKRQLGLVYQERIEDEKVFITGEGAIIPYLVANLCFLGVGTSQGMIVFPEDLRVSKKEIRGQNLLHPEDEGELMWSAIKRRVKERFSEDFNIFGTPDMNSINWDSTIVALTNSNRMPKMPKYEAPIFAITSKTAAYIGAERVKVEKSDWNILTPSLCAISAGLAAQEVLRRNLLIRGSEFLSANLEMRYVIQRNNIYDHCVEFANKHQGLPFDVRIKLGGETVPATFEPFYEEVKFFDGTKERKENRINPDRVIIRCTFPEDSYLTRVVYNLIEILDEGNPEHYKFKESLIISPFKDTKIVNGKIIDVDVNIPSSLENKKIFFLGVGGIGSWVSTLFSLSNTMNCHFVIDDLDDRVEEHNLNRQILFNRASIGIPKAIAAKKALEELNSKNKITALDFELEIGTANNILNKEFMTLEEYKEKKKNVTYIPGTTIPTEVVGEDLVMANEIKDSDLIVAGPDNIRTRYICSLIGKLCKIPLVNAGGEIFEGKVDLFEPDRDCYVCRYGEKSKREVKVVSCTGVLPTLSIVTTISIIGGLQAALSLAHLIKPKENSLHHFMQYYGRYQMLATCSGKACKHKIKKGCPKHLNLEDFENPFKFF